MKLSDVLSQLESGSGVFADAKRYSFPYRGMMAGYIGAEIRKHGDLDLQAAFDKKDPKLSNASRIAIRAVLGITPEKRESKKSPEQRKKLMESARKALERLTQEERIAVYRLTTGGAM